MTYRLHLSQNQLHSWAHLPLFQSFLKKENMTILYRDYQQADLPFLKEMLYEAVFWRSVESRPSFEKGIALPEVKKALSDWAWRAGDTAVIATHNAHPIGAAWYRFWNDIRFDHGFVDENTPVLVIGIDQVYRGQGIGGKLIGTLFERAKQQGVHQISLSVAKDNYAIKLYKRLGFQEYADRGDYFIMVRKL